MLTDVRPKFDQPDKIDEVTLQVFLPNGKTSEHTFTPEELQKYPNLLDKLDNPSVPAGTQVNEIVIVIKPKVDEYVRLL